jgi:hypothetical protein
MIAWVNTSTLAMVPLDQDRKKDARGRILNQYSGTEGASRQFESLACNFATAKGSRAGLESG